MYGFLHTHMWLQAFTLIFVSTSCFPLGKGLKTSSREWLSFLLMSVEGFAILSGLKQAKKWLQIWTSFWGWMYVWQCEISSLKYSVYVPLNICPLIMWPQLGICLVLHFLVLGLWSMRKEVNTFLVGPMGKQTKTWCQLIGSFIYLKSTYNSLRRTSVK